MKNNSTIKKASVVSIRHLFYDFVKYTSAIGYLWFRPKRIFESQAAKKKLWGGNLIIANHIGYSDPIVLMLVVWYRRHHFICTKDLFESWARPFFTGFHCIPIDKENFGMGSFSAITDHLKNDELVCMFPEGRVNEDVSSGINQFKSGMILMSMRSQKPIVPFYIRKRQHFWERSVVAIGEPIDIVAKYGPILNMDQIKEATELLASKERELEKLALEGKKR